MAIAPRAPDEIPCSHLAFVVLDTVFEAGEARNLGDVRLEDIQALRERLEARFK